MATKNTSNDEHTWSMFVHLSSMIGYIGVPFGYIIGPLIIWLIKKNEMPKLDTQGKNALNFNISLTIYAIILGLSSMLIVTMIITIPALLAIVVVHVVLTIKATLQARDGKVYKYPLTITFIK